MIDFAADRPSDGPAAAPEPQAAVEDGPRWRPQPDGTLRAEGADGALVALPAALPPGSPLRDRVLRIGGQDYLVFRL